jgi:uncharacterized protein (TIGR02246 family)
MKTHRTFRLVVRRVFAAAVVMFACLSGFIGSQRASVQANALEISGSGQHPPGSSADRLGRGDPRDRAMTEDEKAIRAADEAFVREYNQGNHKALAARFTEDAEAIEADGERFQGRDLIERRFAETFSASPGVKISLEIGAIRFVSPDVAQEEGRAIVSPPKEVVLVRPYTVLHVKRGGRWLIASVREEPEPERGAHEHLKELEWMVGEWIDEGHDSVVRARCRWSADGNFLMREFTIKRRGKPVMTVSQRIGWDPLARQIRSWEFDSEGGFGEGKWSRDGERWVVKHAAVRPEGTPASAVNIMTRERPDLVRWASTTRVVGDESIPDEESFVLVRVPPAPQTSSPGQSPSPPTPNTKRSPR